MKLRKEWLGAGMEEMMLFQQNFVKAVIAKQQAEADRLEGLSKEHAELQENLTDVKEARAEAARHAEELQKQLQGAKAAHKQEIQEQEAAASERLTAAHRERNAQMAELQESQGKMADLQKQLAAVQNELRAIASSKDQDRSSVADEASRTQQAVSQKLHETE